MAFPSPAAPRPSSITDPNLIPFISKSFSPIDYLNTTLPSSSTSNNTKSPPLSLSALASQTQSHVSALAAQSTRLTETLNALTDDILRVSPRLTYEVELLRGEALSLSENLSPSGNLHTSISQFVPETSSSSHVPVDQNLEHTSTLTSSKFEPVGPAIPSAAAPIDPLRTLLQVRSRLTLVSRIFSLALSWPFPPSLLPKSSQISVPSPADQTYEAQGQAACARLRQEIIDLLAESGDGVLKATERIQELRTCVEVWKGTGEEKARGKYVDGLEAIVEEERERREIKREEVSINKKGNPKPLPSRPNGNNVAPKTDRELRNTDTSSAPGFLRNLQRLRDEMYME